MLSNNIISLIEQKKVFPIVSTEVRNNYKWDKRSNNLDHSVQPLTIEECNAIKEAGYKIKDKVNPGTILMCHPYHPKTLINYKYGYKEYIEEKFGEYATILNLLGATKQELKAKIEKEEKRKVSADGKIKIKGTTLKGKFAKSSEEKFKVEHVCSIRGTGRIDYEKAEKYATAVGLVDDPFVKKILALRKDNPICDYNETITISQDYNDIIDAVASLEAISGMLDLDGHFSKEVSVRKIICISQKVVFKRTNVRLYLNGEEKDRE